MPRQRVLNKTKVEHHLRALEGKLENIETSISLLHEPSDEFHLKVLKKRRLSIEDDIAHYEHELASLEKSVSADDHQAQGLSGFSEGGPAPAVA